MCVSVCVCVDVWMYVYMYVGLQGIGHISIKKLFDQTVEHHLPNASSSLIDQMPDYSAIQLIQGGVSLVYGVVGGSQTGSYD